ncbi:class A beta-lactamase [Oceanicola sp. D3]|uniref:class A beta-lactamase n=1 Tax=Oceanicola sp. D3 TaxID=2587163 RepID=UPI0011239D57|nr:class A beta-lactamase [Oceanicola sp. D3]QDC08026.1 class A beta-lactamase [Oceanicola sp. D3]
MIRRHFLTSAAALTATPLLGQTGTREYHPRSYDEGLIPRFSFELIEQEAQGSLGVLALDTATGRRAGWRADERFPFNSTFKALLAGLVLERVDAGAERLDRRIPIRAADILNYAPVTAAAQGNSLTIGQLCAAAVGRSDNTAANLLLDTLGGPSGFTTRLAHPDARIDAWEPALNTFAPGDPANTVTPSSMVSLMTGFLLEQRLSEASRAQLLAWLRAASTGAKRIRAGVPSGWQVGHKTGTGPGGCCSDVAIIHPPQGRAPLMLAIYVAGSERPTARIEPLFAELTRIACANLLAG